MAKKKAKAAEGCKCLKQANDQLSEKGMELDTAMAMNLETGHARVVGPLLVVRWRDKPKRGKRLPTFTCAYCPMCGKKNPD